MSRIAWTAVSAAVVALGLVAALVALVVGGGGGGSADSVVNTTPSSSTQGFSLPLALDSSALALGKHTGNVLVGLAAKRGGPIQVAAIHAETPLPTDELSFTLDGRSVESQPCGNGCSRIDSPVLDGTPSELTVRAGSAQVSFRLPALLPPNGEAIFARAVRTMDGLKAYRFTETLTSGLGGVVSEYQVQAPDRLSLSTGEFRTVIIGRKRWDYHDGRWESGPFPGLNVADILMWHRAKHARVVGHGPNGVTRLAAFGLEPVPAWFRLTVQPSGRVLEAEMTAASHFMTHRYRDFNGSIEIEAPK
ncbi:MAG: hypothetical protein AABM30_04780 [Actinomycetota bacterium]